MSLRHFLDYYRGRISYTEAINMPFKTYHTLTYIMYRENLEREKQQKLKAEQERKKAENEAKQQADARRMEEQQKMPRSGREELMMRLRQNQNQLMDNPNLASANPGLPQETEQPAFPVPQMGPEDIVDMIEDEL